MRFIIARHAETQWNKNKIIQGKLDSPINDRGYKQIKELVNSIKELNISRILSFRACIPNS